ncbi:VOC family protein [Actinophytocola sp.]|jgi:uncharacterized glyoxalase superfamily protein PhnB|uniref:VOC family protein n=1 Tax=Actinophytocola sp. TaxID=1872138 RepID=UPI002ED8254B
MSDPFEAAFEAAFDALREPVVPVDPDPRFAARLREQLTRAVLDQQGLHQQGADMTTTQTVRREPAWPPSLAPYIVVSDARRALAWYAEVLGAQQRGEPHVDTDGTIGHAELGLGDAVLMLSEPSDLYADVPVAAPDAPTTFSHTLHLEVADVDATTDRARRRGAAVEREPADEPYGRRSIIVDPFGHRWLLLRPPARATRFRQGDVARVTMIAADPGRTKAFYESVLQLPFTAGSQPGAWRADDTNPPLGLWSPEGVEPQVQLCFRVDDMAAALGRVRAAGGTAADAERKPYGLLAECTDDQGTRFQLWEPPD